jgi:hypothetical protein
MVPLLLLVSALAGTWPEPMTSVELSEQRGGFRLPNGIEVAITVQTDTAVDRTLVLRTVYVIDQGPAALKVFTGGAGPSGTRADATPTSAPMPLVTYDSRTGILVTPGISKPSVSVTAGSPQQGTEVGDIQEVALRQAGAETAFGTVSRASRGHIEAVRLDGPDLAVTHLVGSAFGSLIENVGNGRTIDTTTTIAIDLKNAGPDVLGSTLPRIDALGVDAMQTRVR